MNAVLGCFHVSNGSKQKQSVVCQPVSNEKKGDKQDAMATDETVSLEIQENGRNIDTHSTDAHTLSRLAGLFFFSFEELQWRCGVPMSLV